MSSIIPLEAIPNQEFTIRLENLRYTVRINSVADSCTVATITRDGATVINGTRIVANELLIPYPYLEGAGGNFFLETPDDELPDYEQFGSTHRLIYFTREELEAMRARI